MHKLTSISINRRFFLLLSIVLFSCLTVFVSFAVSNALNNEAKGNTAVNNPVMTDDAKTQEFKFSISTKTSSSFILPDCSALFDQTNYWLVNWGDSSSDEYVEILPYKFNQASHAYLEENKVYTITIKPADPVTHMYKADATSWMTRFGCVNDSAYTLSNDMIKTVFSPLTWQMTRDSVNTPRDNEYAGMFSDCCNLDFNCYGFDFPEEVTIVGDNFASLMFQNCYSLKALPEQFCLPCSLTTVGSSFLEGMFMDCKSLARIGIFHFPDNIVAAGSQSPNAFKNTFRNCSSLGDGSRYSSIKDIIGKNITPSRPAYTFYNAGYFSDSESYFSTNWVNDDYTPYITNPPKLFYTHYSFELKNAERFVEKPVVITLNADTYHSKVVKTQSSAYIIPFEHYGGFQGSKEISIRFGDYSHLYKSRMSCQYDFDRISAKEWMTSIPGDRNIACMNIPASHDSGTFNMSAIKSSMSRCQTLSIDQQLDAGVRMFDLRMAYNNSHFFLCHGDSAVAGDLSECTCYDTDGKELVFHKVLEYFCDFLIHHPGETILMNTQWESRDMDDYISHLKTNIENFRYHIYTGSGYPLLKDVRGKIVWSQSGSATATLDDGSQGILDSTGRTSTFANFGGVHFTPVFCDWESGNDDPQKTVDAVKEFFKKTEAYDGFYGNMGAICRCNSYKLNCFGLPYPSEVYDLVNPMIREHTFIKGKLYGFFQMDMVDEVLATKVFMSNLFY